MKRFLDPFIQYIDNDNNLHPRYIQWQIESITF